MIGLGRVIAKMVQRLLKGGIASAASR